MDAKTAFTTLPSPRCENNTKVPNFVGNNADCSSDKVIFLAIARGGHWRGKRPLESQDNLEPSFLALQTRIRMASPPAPPSLEGCATATSVQRGGGRCSYAGDAQNDQLHTNGGRWAAPASPEQVAGGAYRMGFLVRDSAQRCINLCDSHNCLTQVRKIVISAPSLRQPGCVGT